MLDNFEWLGGLMVGDEVAYNISIGARPTYKVSRIEKITPTRQIVLADGSRFQRNGSRELHGHTFTYIVPVTGDIRDGILRSSLLDTISKAKYWKFETQHLVDIVNVIINGKA